HEGRSESHSKRNQCRGASVTIVRADETEEGMEMESGEVVTGLIKNGWIEDGYGHPDAFTFGGSPLAVQSPEATVMAGRKRGGSGEEKSTVSSTELKCVLWNDYGTHSLTGYRLHLARTHKSTLGEAGIIFRCACGNESRAEAHFSKCHGASVTIVRDSMNDEGECAMEQPQMSRNSENNVGNVTGEQRVNKSSTEMRCVLCDEYGTNSVAAYRFHLQDKHHTNASEAEILFRCACGNESRGESHFTKCPSTSVRIVRDGEERESELAIEQPKLSVKADYSENGEQRVNKSSTEMRCVLC
ncbi:hypothetical protein PFISCL1PPCAC_11574, partial [Pristionchus fissidentatus]